MVMIDLAHRKRYITGVLPFDTYDLLNYLTFVIINYPKKSSLFNWGASWLKKIKIGKGKIEISYVGYERIFPQNLIITFESKVNEAGNKVIHVKALNVEEAVVFLNFIADQLKKPSAEWQLAIKQSIVEKDDVIRSTHLEKVDGRCRIAWLIDNSLRNNPNYFMGIVKSRALSKVEVNILRELWDYKEMDFPLFEDDVLRIIQRSLGIYGDSAVKMLLEIKNKFLKRGWIRVVKT